MPMNFEQNDRVLWLITGIGSIPFAILGLARVHWMLMTWPIYGLMFVVVLFNGVVAPLFILRGNSNSLKKILAIGLNLILATLWVRVTGNEISPFFPFVYFLPILASTMHGTLADSILTAIAAAFFTILIKTGAGVSFTQVILGPEGLVAVIFLLTAVSLGYLITLLRNNLEQNRKLAMELDTAYREAAAAHEQLQLHTQEIERMNVEIQQLAVTDEMTRLYNYRYFSQVLQQDLARHRVVSLMMLDMDDFKLYNDRYGHPAGDQLLGDLARVLRDNVRTQDTVARYGGEEFSVILPGAEAEEAARVAERIRKAVEIELAPPAPAGNIKVTISIGLAAFPRDAIGASELVSHSDMALYTAKRNGKNQVVCYQDTMSNVI